jgi:hypothetical protein
MWEDFILEDEVAALTPSRPTLGRVGAGFLAELRLLVKLVRAQGDAYKRH